jgi:hypothetical protein
VESSSTFVFMFDVFVEVVLLQNSFRLQKHEINMFMSYSVITL